MSPAYDPQEKEDLNDANPHPGASPRIVTYMTCIRCGEDHPVSEMMNMAEGWFCHRCHFTVNDYGEQ